MTGVSRPFYRTAAALCGSDGRDSPVSPARESTGSTVLRHRPFVPFLALAFFGACVVAAELPTTWRTEITTVDETAAHRIEFSARKCPAVTGIGRYDIGPLEDNVAVDREMKEAIVKYGALRCRYFHAGVACTESTHAHYLVPIAALSVGDDFHDVNVIGWDDDYAVDNFREEMRPVGKGAFLCRDLTSTAEMDDIWISYEDISFNYDGAWTRTNVPPHPVPTEDDWAVVSSFSVDGASATISFAGDPQFSYHLKAADSLSPAIWYDFGPTNVGRGAQSFDIPIDMAHPRRFFKIETIQTP